MEQVRLYPKDQEKVISCAISGEPIAEGEDCVILTRIDKYMKRGIFEMFRSMGDSMTEFGETVLTEMHYTDTKEMTAIKPKNNRFYKFALVHK